MKIALDSASVLQNAAWFKTSVRRAELRVQGRPQATLVPMRKHLVRSMYVSIFPEFLDPKFADPYFFEGRIVREMSGAGLEIPWPPIFSKVWGLGLRASYAKP